MHTFVRLLTLEPLERHPGRVFTAIGFVFAIVYVAAFTVFPRHGRIIDGDAIQYYAYLRSLVVDRDVDFTNDYRLLYRPTDGGNADNVWLRTTTSRGRPPNVMSIGPALLWAPAFLATYATLALLRPLGLAIPLDGLAAPFLLSVGLAGIAYATLGAFFCYRSCRLLFAARPALWGALAAWLATPAVYYSLISPAYSHATSLFASALFCYVWLKTRGGDSIRRDVWLGILAGLATLVRWQDVVILVLPLSELAWAVAKGRSRLASSALHASVMLGVVVTLLLPQFFAWQAIYGRFFLVPQGGGFMQWTSPALISVLFSLRHGLFSWTPAVLVAVIGFYYLVRRDAVVGWSAAAVFLLAVYINAAVSDWWAGEAFGARRFVGYSVVFALGLAALFASDFWQKRPVLQRSTAVALVVYNLLFLLQYQLFMRGFQQFAPYPATIRQVLLDRLTLPWQLLRAWMGP